MVSLSNVPAKFNWCAYVSDYPPNVTANNGSYTFHGTLPFTLTAANGTTTQTISDKTVATAAVTITPVTLTDRTGCPGVFCVYSGTDLYIDATHLCQQRTSGAQNWEAWIKDTRDTKLYRIVYMPDNHWWLAQNVKYAGTGSAVSGCTEDDCGRGYPLNVVWGSWGGTTGSTGNVQGVCPPGWVLPTSADWTSFTTNLGVSDAQRAERIRSKDSYCSPIPDYFGWANNKMTWNASVGSWGDSNWYTNSNVNARHCGLMVDKSIGQGCTPPSGCGNVILDWCTYVSVAQAGGAQVSTVRCLK
jgi:uncharacterized protein (TIGR02145 family)